MEIVKKKSLKYCGPFRFGTVAETYFYGSDVPVSHQTIKFFGIVAFGIFIGLCTSNNDRITITEIIRAAIAEAVAGKDAEIAQFAAECKLMHNELEALKRDRAFLQGELNEWRKIAEEFADAFAVMKSTEKDAGSLQI